MSQVQDSWIHRPSHLNLTPSTLRVPLSVIHGRTHGTMNHQQTDRIGYYLKQPDTETAHRYHLIFNPRRIHSGWCRAVVIASFLRCYFGHAQAWRIWFDVVHQYADSRTGDSRQSCYSSRFFLVNYEGLNGCQLNTPALAMKINRRSANAKPLLPQNYSSSDRQKRFVIDTTGCQFKNVAGTWHFLALTDKQ